MTACYLFFLLGVVTFITGFIKVCFLSILWCILFQNTCFLYVSDNMTIRLRKKFIEALLRQDVAWFDSRKTGELSTRLFRYFQPFLGLI